MGEKLKAIDFFCSGGGMTCGLRKAGIRVIAGIDIDETCEDTYSRNNHGVQFLCRDIFSYDEVELEKDIPIHAKEDNLIFIGCSPCQYWSLINRNKEKALKSRNLLTEFSRFVEFYQPGYVLVENVPNIIKNKEDSGLLMLLQVLEKHSYQYQYGIFKLNDYGVPQNRKRFSLVANRLGIPCDLPEKSNEHLTVRDFLGVQHGFPRIEAGYVDQTNFQHSASKLSIDNLEVAKKTPVGDKRSYKIRKGNVKKQFSDSYCRIYWDKPAPTITTKFHSISNGRFIHPEENRGLSFREGATLQTFPKDYVFYGNQAQICKMIGNAVPPEYAYRIGKSIVKGNLDYDKTKK